MFLFNFMFRKLQETSCGHKWWQPFVSLNTVLVLSDAHLSPDDSKPNEELMSAAKETEDPWEESSEDGWLILHGKTEHRLDETAMEKVRLDEETTRSMECPKEEDDICKGPESEKGGTPIQPSTAATSEALRPQEAQDSTPVKAAAPNMMPLACATDGEGFGHYPSQGRSWVQRHQRARTEAEREAKLAEFRQFSSTFKLDTPVPSDLLSILARDPPKKKKMHEKAQRKVQEYQ